MENLTKKNFWNEMYERYPSEMAEFCKWIDEYKKTIQWDSLFRPFPYGNEQKGYEIQRTPKYHELPLALQIGIFMCFQFETEADISREGTMLENARKAINNHFQEMVAFKHREQAAGDGNL